MTTTAEVQAGLRAPRTAGGTFWAGSTGGGGTLLRDLERAVKLARAEAEGATTDALPEAEAEAIQQRRDASRGWRRVNPDASGRWGA